MNMYLNQRLYYPIAEWTGRLILPLPQERRPDGGVYLQLENAPEPYTHLKGQRVWLCWHPQSIHQRWLTQATIDIQFDEMTRKSQAKGLIHPTRLDGWQQVSPLESLAGARAQDDVQVELEVLSVHPKGAEWVIQINDEPIQITGILHGLVQFVTPVGETAYRVKHYNPESQRFDGVEEIVNLPDAGSIHPQFQLEQSSIKNIEQSPLNAFGWYIYGHYPTVPSPIPTATNPMHHLFVVQALEPVEAQRLNPSEMVMGRAEAQAYISKNKWKQIPMYRVEVTLVDTNGKPNDLKERSLSQRQQRTKELWLRDDEALVIHTFGWRGGNRGDRPPLGITPGHFAFGFAKLEHDKFLGILRFNLVYRQVYTHNALGTIAGAHRWHSYMGCLKRGWMYTLPVSDVMLRMPELTVPYKMDERIFNPLDLIKQELALMTARYRTGDGNGATIVTPAASCVKDSNQALFAAIQKFRDSIRKEPAITIWLERNADNFHAKRFLRLEALLHQIKQEVLMPLGYVPPGWRGEISEIAAQKRDRMNLDTVLEGLKAWKTMLPRRAERELLNVLRNYGATMIDYQSAMIGGEVPGIVPLAPTVIL
jgi:predicted Abi (CAAX) family protease